MRAPFWLIRVGPPKSSNDPLRVVKTFRLHLPVVDAAHVEELLDMVTDVDGVVAALVEADATLHVVVSKDASALLVREQLMGLAQPASA